MYATFNIITFQIPISTVRSVSQHICSWPWLDSTSTRLVHSFVRCATLNHESVSTSERSCLRNAFIGTVCYLDTVNWIWRLPTQRCPFAVAAATQTEIFRVVTGPKRPWWCGSENSDLLVETSLNWTIAYLWFIALDSVALVNYHSPHTLIPETSLLRAPFMPTLTSTATPIHTHWHWHRTQTEQHFSWTPSQRPIVTT